MFKSYLNGSRLLTATLDRLITTGSLLFIDAEGRSTQLGDGSGRRITMRIHDPAIQFPLVVYPSFYLGEGFMNGQWAVEQGDLKDFLELIFTNLSAKSPPAWLAFTDRCTRIAMRLRQMNTAEQSAKQMEHHYDLGTDFYDLFLDKDRQYSCAYFSGDGEASLEEAQLMKKLHLRRKLMIDSSHRVLDIGCGWGGLALSIARTTGAQVTGITLSKDQLAVARARAKEMKLSDQVDFELLDYRAVSGKFDRIVSVGMFEHVGVSSYSAYFGKMRDMLTDDGIALLHSIGRSSPPCATNTWIRKRIFPGGHIPSLSEVLPHVERARLHLTDVEILRMHYAKTLRHWRLRFKQQCDGQNEPFKRKYDERFRRMWEFYLAGSETAFERFGLMVFQMQLATHARSVPITRDYMYGNSTGTKNE